MCYSAILFQKLNILRQNSKVGTTQIQRRNFPRTSILRRKACRLLTSTSNWASFRLVLFLFLVDFLFLTSSWTCPSGFDFGISTSNTHFHKALNWSTSNALRKLIKLKVFTWWAAHFLSTIFGTLGIRMQKTCYFQIFQRYE